MTGPMAGGRRRIDRVLADGFLDGLAEADLDDLRDRRHDADQEDADLSYIRRLLQGRIDIVRAEQSRRTPGGDERPIIEHLAEILADSSRGTHGLGRFLTVEPSRVDEHRREVEQIVADAGISDVEARTDAELAEALERLQAHEAEVSAARRRVQDVSDALAAEIGRRYRDGAASVSDVLPTE